MGNILWFPVDAKSTIKNVSHGNSSETPPTSKIPSCRVCQNRITGSEVSIHGVSKKLATRSC